MLAIKILENIGDKYFPIDGVKNLRKSSENGIKEIKNKYFCNQI